MLVRASMQKCGEVQNETGGAAHQHATGHRPNKRVRQALQPVENTKEDVDCITPKQPSPTSDMDLTKSTSPPPSVLEAAKTYGLYYVGLVTKSASRVREVRKAAHFCRNRQGRTMTVWLLGIESMV